jgi:hypothetical protein
MNEAMKVLAGTELRRVWVVLEPRLSYTFPFGNPIHRKLRSVARSEGIVSRGNYRINKLTGGSVCRLLRWSL